MKSQKIKDQNNKTYTLKINENNLKKEIINGRMNWNIEYTVWKGEGGQMGFGHIKFNCSQDHEHVSDDRMLDALVNIGSKKIIDDINNEQDIESRSYNISIKDCTK